MATCRKRNICESFTDNEVNALVSAYQAQEDFLNLEYSTLSSSDRFKIWNQIAERVSSIDGIQRTGKECAEEIRNWKQKSGAQLVPAKSKTRFPGRVCRQASSECVFCSQCVDPLDTPQLSLELVDAVCTILHLVPLPTIGFNWKECLLHYSFCASCHGMVIDAQELMVALDLLQNKIDKISTSIGNAIRKGHFDFQNEAIISEESCLTGSSSLPSPSDFRAQLATFLELRPLKFRCNEPKEEIMDVDITEDLLMSNFDNVEIEDTIPLLNSIESTFNWNTKPEPDLLSSVSTNDDRTIYAVETYESILYENELSDQNYQTTEKFQDSDSNCAEDRSDEDRNRTYSVEQDHTYANCNGTVLTVTDSPHRKCLEKPAPNFSKNEIRVLWTEFRKREEDMKSMPQSYDMWSEIAKFVSGVSKLTCGRSAFECRMEIKNLRDNSIDIEEFLEQPGEEETQEPNNSECHLFPENDFDQTILTRRASKFSEAEVKALCTQYFEQRENLMNVDKIQKQAIWENIAKVVSYVDKVKRPWRSCQKKITKLRSSLPDLSTLGDRNTPTMSQRLDKTVLSFQEMCRINLSKYEKKTRRAKLKQTPYFSLEEMRVLYQEAKKWDSALKDKQKSHEIYRQIAKLVSEVSNIKRTALQCCEKLKNMKYSEVDYDKMFEQDGANGNTDIILQKSHDKDLYCAEGDMEYVENDDNAPQYLRNHKRRITDQTFRRVSRKKPEEYKVVLSTGVVLLQYPKLHLTRCDDPNGHFNTDQMNSFLENLSTAVERKQTKVKLLQKGKTGTIVSTEETEFLKRRQGKCCSVERSLVRKRRRRKRNENCNSVDVKYYICPVTNCGEKIIGALEIERHVMYEHARDDTPRPNHCDIGPCWRSFYTIQGLEHHKTRCHDESLRTFHCDMCTKSYISFGLLKSHKIYAHNNSPFCCDVCGKSYRRKDDLINHQGKIHGDLDPKRFKPELMTCPICSYRCARVSLLPKHMKRHIDNGLNLKCSELGCDFKTDVMSKLKIHKFSHSVGRNCRCHLCPMTYKKTVELNRHIRLHSGILNHKCPYCEKAFPVKTYLTNHINVNHDRQIRFTCEDCGKGFSIMKYYQKHRSLAHKESNGVTGIEGRG